MGHFLVHFLGYSLNGSAPFSVFMTTGCHIFRNVLIGLMQLDTRCSDSTCQAQEDLIAGFSAIEAEAELVQIGLKLCASAVISAEQERFQVADGFVQPVQVARFILFRVQRNARQVPIALIAVAFDF